jgi:tetratricopeptide (TPR) repeat protein
VLLTLERYEDSLAVLKELELLVPKEAPVHIMIGKINKILGKKDVALRAFNKALDLDQKDTNMVKSLIDKLDQNQEMHDESDL